MRFCEHLSAHLTPEWRTQYVHYEELRDYLTKAAEEAPSEDMDNGVMQQRYFEKCDQEFFVFCAAEATKINDFFEEKLAEARRKFVALKCELIEYEEHVNHRTTVWQSLQMLASGAGDRKKQDRRTRRNAKKVVERLNLNDDSVIEIEMNGTSIGGKDFNRVNSSRLSRRISSANFQYVIQRTQERRKELRREKRQVRKLHDIKLGFSEFYLSLVLLQNYQSLNFTGFRKILKKHDKLFIRRTGEEWRKTNIDNSYFHTNKEVDQLITKVETLYTRKLEDGDRSRAMKRLRVPPLAQKLNTWTTFRVGYLFGLFSVQEIVNIKTAISHTAKNAESHTEEIEAANPQSVLVILVSLICLQSLPRVWEPALRLYRGTFIVSIFILLIGINTYGWQLAGVNHVLIFEIDPRNHLTHQEFLEVSGLLLNSWSLSLLYFLYSPVVGCPEYAGPFVLTLFFVIYLLNPFRCLHYKARRWLLRILIRIFLAPLNSVNFADFWLADQLNSLAIVFLDGLFFACFYTSQIDWKGGLAPIAAVSHHSNSTSNSSLNAYVSKGGICSTQLFGVVTVVKCLPAWFRFAQCLRRYYDMTERAPYPHLLNAGKYSTTFFVATFSALYSSIFPNSTVILAFFLVSSIIGTIYTYAWDILMDWGLFDFNEVKCNARTLLRDELVYRNTVSYYFAIIEDLILRLSWVPHMILSHFFDVNNDILVCVLALGEAFRRFVWNFFRLENEHLNNCGQFRAVRDIFISPISSREVTKGTPKSQRSATSDSSGVGGSSSTGYFRGNRKMSDTPQRYQPKGNRLFASRTSLTNDHGQAHYHPVLEAPEGLQSSSLSSSVRPETPKFELSYNV